MVPEAKGDRGVVAKAVGRPFLAAKVPLKLLKEQYNTACR